MRQLRRSSAAGRGRESETDSDKGLAMTFRSLGGNAPVRWLKAVSKRKGEKASEEKRKRGTMHRGDEEGKDQPPSL